MSDPLQAPNEAQRLRALIDAIPVGLAVVNGDGELVLANRSLQQQFGYTESELVGQPASMLLPERFKELHPLLPQVAPHAAGSTTGPRADPFGRRKDGTEFPLEIGLNTIDTATGPAAIAALSDITVRRRLEYNFSQIVDASPVGKLVVDNAGVIQLVNARLCRLFGYPREQLIGQQLQTLLPASREALESQLADRPNKDPELAGDGCDLLGVRSDGSELSVEVGFSRIQTENGTAIVAAVIDISERKKMEEHLRKLNADLDEFTYVASHDLRAPLQGIASLVEWIAEDIEKGSKDDVQNNLARIGVRVRRMERLIDELLLYARAGRTPSAFEQVALDALVHKVVTFVEPPASFEIRIQTPQAEVMTPRVALETVLRNLISNAVQHHDRDTGCISVDVQRHGRRLTFSVADDGPGIPRQAQQRMFRLFQGMGTASGDHSGIGLAVSKRLVESYGGRLEVLSEDGRRGATFRFRWPCEMRREDDAS